MTCPKGEVASSLRGDGDEGKVRAACIRLSLPANELAIGTMLRCFDDALFGDLDNYVSSSVSRSAVVAAADADKDGALACAELAPVIRFYASCPSSTSTTRGSRPRWRRSRPAHEPRLLLLAPRCRWAVDRTAYVLCSWSRVYSVGVQIYVNVMYCSYT